MPRNRDSSVCLRFTASAIVSVSSSFLPAQCDVIPGFPHPLPIRIMIPARSPARGKNLDAVVQYVCCRDMFSTLALQHQ